MSDFFLKRLQKEKRELNVKEKPFIQIRESDDVFFEKEKSRVVDPEELKKQLINKLNEESKIIMNEENKFSNIEMVHFSSLEEFVSWYEKNKSFFEEKQQKPLDTLIQARDMTLGGCNCNKQQRKNMANTYFIDFWTKNRNTDLLPTLQKILKTKKIVFGDFLSYP
jgi:nitrous oxide reductase